MTFMQPALNERVIIR